VRLDDSTVKGACRPMIGRLPTSDTRGEGGAVGTWGEGISPMQPTTDAHTLRTRKGIGGRKKLWLLGGPHRAWVWVSVIGSVG
jgi:hypothetical protein